MNRNEPMFSYCLINNKEGVSSDNQKDFHYIGCYILYTDGRTPLQYSEKDGRELIIFGYAIDVFNGQSDDLAKVILESTNSLDEVIEYEKKLGGKYIIFYAKNGKCYCLGDATCSVPVFYTVGLSGFVCCSNPKLIIDDFGLTADGYLQKIRDSGPLNQAMPYDVTPYKEIKQLIPNHYLDIGEEKAVRFVNSQKKQKKISPEKAAEITAPMIERIAKMYLSEFKIYCPLTSGRDSRVVYAFLCKLSKGKVLSYTVWHDRFKKDSQDWDIPVLLAKKMDFLHEQIYQSNDLYKYRDKMNLVLGEKGYPDEAFSLAITLNKHYGDGAICEGDIIGQVGKCSLHRDIPLFLATPSYFRCKLHNYSTQAKKLLAEWMNEIKTSKEKVNIFDLFSVENRLGRWATQTHLIHNTIGQPYFNIFNSRSIIYVYTAVDRSKRMKSEIHLELIKNTVPELLEIHFEKEKNGLVNLAKSNAWIFYAASFMKFFVQRVQFNRKNK